MESAQDIGVGVTQTSIPGANCGRSGSGRTPALAHGVAFCGYPASACPGIEYLDAYVMPESPDGGPMPETTFDQLYDVVTA
jgi:hypothetical protein